MSVEKSVKKRRSAIKIMGQLIGLVAPLLHIMLLAILLGVMGYLCAIFLTILASQVLLKGLGEPATVFSDMSIKTLFIIMGMAAVMRGVLHYAEQYCNHFIAFKLLAIIRHKVFAALRRLCPAKLEGRDKGNLISVITTDIELLEVFYAHTISPIMIALLTSAVMVIFMGRYSPVAAVYAAAVYIIVGIFIPLWNGKRGGQTGMEFRTSFGELNSFVLSALRGLSETIQYGMGKEKRHRAVTNFVILLASFGMLFLMGEMYRQGEIGFDAVVTCTVAMMGSFGPVVALASLSNNLNQTLASGERVLSVIEENPVVEEVWEDKSSDSKAVYGDKSTKFTGEQVSDTKLMSDEKNVTAEVTETILDKNRTENSADRKNKQIAALKNVTFAYENENILKNFSMEIKKGKITGLHGVSGCGKSTILKLLMRFWDTDSGEVEISGKNVKEISTKKLRDYESFVTQETDIFHDTIAANIGIAKIGATTEEIIAAAKKASLHDLLLVFQTDMIRRSVNLEIPCRAEKNRG